MHTRYCLCLTGSNDYTPVSDAELVFQPISVSQPVCADILVVDDGILENNENFLVILDSSDRAVTIATSISTINIINDDRK